LTECGLQEHHLSSDADSVTWRDPAHLPGLHVMIRPEGPDMWVTLAQDLYGPVRPSDAYRCVKPVLRRQLEWHFGKARVRVKS
jgi:hypothetical protein